jgi:hypothetical protein
MKVLSSAISFLSLSLLLTPSTAIPANTQSCHAVDDQVNSLDDLGSLLSGSIVRVTWHIDIGVSFAGGEGCSNIESLLVQAVGTSFTEFSCTDDGSGDTALQFEGFEQTGVGAKINAAMEKLIPSVNGFNCPDF